MKNTKSRLNHYLKDYVTNLIFINFIAIIFLYNTTSFDQGILSIQSIFYSINKILLILFAFIETISSFIDAYGVTFETLKIGLINFKTLNFKYILILFIENINYLFFLLSAIIFTKYKKEKIFQNKIKISVFTTLIFFFIIISISTIGINNSSNYFTSFKNRLVHNSILRNDNWFLIANISGIENENQINNNLAQNFSIEDIVRGKKNIYIIINESYPNFKNKKLYNNLFNKIIDNSNVKHSIFKREYSNEFTTLAAEEFVLCNKFTKSFMEIDLKEYLINKKCWSNKIKKSKIFIHSYKKDFFNRYDRYNSFFDELYFNKELKINGIKECPWNDVGSCDYDILNNLSNVIQDTKNHNFVIFLTLNNHLGLIYKTYDKEFLNCKKK